MKISLNWINDYLDTSLDNSIISEGLTDLGLENTFNKICQSFEGVFIGKVMECVKDENSDYLNICQVDVGEDNFLQIVCGAPNIKKDLYVPVAKVGATLDSGSFKIKNTKIRGINSFGMICSEKELGLSDKHDGIMVINDNCTIGQNLSELIKINEDTIFDIDLTPNRGDCLSHIGVAREVSLLEKKDISQPSININDKASNSKIEDFITINIENEDLCTNYQARIVSGVNVSDSPQWLVNKLASIGQKSINNVVDAANYIMFDLGQPLHAFDYDKISNKVINVRAAINEEKVKTLDGNDNILNESNIVISDDKKILAIAGVMGCSNSSVTDQTMNILIESAIFNPIYIRKGSKRLGISTDASKRFERGVDNNFVNIALDKMANLVVDIAGGKVVDGIAFSKSQNDKLNDITFRLDKCIKVLGVDINKNDIEEIFHSLSIKFISSKEDQDILECVTPSYRNDLTREIDLIEEVARVIGYNKIDSSEGFFIPINTLMNKDNSNKNKVRNILSNIGFNEHYSNSLINYDQCLQFEGLESVKILNPLSSDMEYVRNSLIPGVLKSVSYNENRQLDYFKLFEIGAISTLNKHKYNISDENEKLCMAFYGTGFKHWKNTSDLDIFEVKSNISLLLDKMGFNFIEYKISKYKNSNLALDIFIKKSKVGIIFFPTSKIKKYYKIKGNVIISEVNLDRLKIDSFNEKILKIEKYPSSNRDLSISVSKNYKAQDILDTILSSSNHSLKDVNIVDVYNSKELGANYVGLTFALKFQSSKYTMKDDEVDTQFDRILSNLKRQYKITQR